MNHIRTFLFVGLYTAVIFLMLSAIAVPVGPVTITGTVNSDNQIVADDGEVYTVAEREDREDLAQYEGEEVRVTGMVEVRGGEKFISIVSYEVLAEEEDDEDEDEYEEE
jgi:hypothetical protein